MNNPHLATWQIKHHVSDEAMRELAAMWFTTPSQAGLPGSEAQVQQECRVRAAQGGAVLWRNNSGAAQDADGRHVRYGLGNDSKRLNEKYKSSDLIGITPRTSTRAGQVFGVFTALEVKHPGWMGPKSKHEMAQGNYLTDVLRCGGIGAFISDVSQYEELLR